MNWILNPAAGVSAKHQQQAIARQGQLTKPPGSLGRLEDVAVHLAALQHCDAPKVERMAITIFAADHGVAGAGVSAFPQSVTAQMVQNFAFGGAAISVLAKELGAELQVYNLGTVSKLDALPGVRDCRIAAGTQNLAEQAAMSNEQLQQALTLGSEAIADAGKIDLWLGGEMGIANTTSATALACALLNIEPATLVGPGTGVNPETQIHKARVIETAIALHTPSSSSAVNSNAVNGNTSALACHYLQHLGGFEIAALTGAYIAAAQQGLPVLVDGFICTVAALYARAINPGVSPWLMLSHASAEPGHQQLVAHWDQPPLLQLDMRLGEGSGAAMTIPLLRLACALHNNMATFADASVDGQVES